MRVNGLYEKFVLPVGIPVGSPIRVREAEAVEYTEPVEYTVSIAMRVTQEELDAAAASAREAADMVLDEMDRAMRDQEDARARAAMPPPIYESEDVPKGTPFRMAATGAIYVHPDDTRWAEAIACGWRRVPDPLLLFQDFPSEEMDYSQETP